jgi:hypothetical protein
MTEWKSHEIQKCRVSSEAILRPFKKIFDGATYQVFATILSPCLWLDLHNEVVISMISGAM